MAVHGDARGHGGHRHDRQCDVGELAVGRGLPRLAQLNKRDDERQGPYERDGRGGAELRKTGGGGAT